jgi:hypothetical protein
MAISTSFISSPATAVLAMQCSSDEPLFVELAEPTNLHPNGNTAP